MRSSFSPNMTYLALYNPMKECKVLFLLGTPELINFSDYKYALNISEKCFHKGFSCTYAYMLSCTQIGVWLQDKEWEKHHKTILENFPAK